MKRFIMIFTVCFLVGVFSINAQAATRVFSFTGLTGSGTDGIGAGNPALDGIPVASIVDGSFATGYSGDQEYNFYYVAASAAAESSPLVIIPNDNASGTGAWKKLLPGSAMYGDSVEITLSAGGIAAISSPGIYTIDTNADAATDDLDQITGLTVGDEIVIGPDNDARTVVVKNGANINLCNEADFTMNNTKDRITLLCTAAGVVVEKSTRSNGGN